MHFSKRIARNTAGLLCILMLIGCSADQQRKADMKASLVFNDVAAVIPPEASKNGKDAKHSGTPEKKKDVRAEYFDGTGVFTKEVPPIKAVTVEKSGGVSLTFKNTDLRVIIRAVLADTLKESYTIDPRVNGKASLETSGAISKTALRDTLEAVLRTKGYALVMTSDGLEVLPVSEAPHRVAAIRHNLPASVSLPGFGVEVVTLKYTAPSAMKELMEPFTPQGGILRTDDEHGYMILGGTSQEVTGMMRAIETFDVDWMKGMSYAIYTLKYAEVEPIVKELNDIFDAPKTPTKGLVRFIPIPRINKLLAIAPKKETLQSIEFWINKLDIGESSPGRRIYVYQVKNGRATDMAGTLNMILGTQMGYGYGGYGNYGNRGASGGYPYGGGRTSTGQRGNISGISNRQNGRGTTGIAGMTGGSLSANGTLGESGIRIVPNEENNSVAILATPSEFSVIESALNKLDVMPKQVLIEATLAEVTLNNELRYGLQWHFETGDNIISFGKNTTPSAQFPGFNWGYANGGSVSAVLNALESMTDVKVISSPKILVLNNQSATLQVGDQVPVPVSSSVSNDNTSARTVNSIQYRDTGVILTVTPRINDGGLVMLDIQQEVSDVVQTSSSGIDAPTIQQRRMTSTVAIQNGTTVALGGLIRRSISKTKSGLPILKDIPILGAAFRNTTNVERRSELVVLLTPRIIQNVDEQREVMDYLQREFRNIIAPGKKKANAKTK
ncbi:type II secretion system secretin GspD [Kordiimonas marina]|uniref:type II secretion system secretin GspD n=1 Tax=Kordiimonas marina TaxID=2872312 RepID=UPI001FF196D8|nr:type II secretion system secretin GspD [Kordiimonas marina]MCJ9430033.1 type II secretion system secretin GspD [Kordiimonas marina]